MRLKTIIGLAILASLFAIAANAQNLNQPVQLNNLNVPGPFQGGTWTPAVAGTSTAGAFTYSQNSGTYEIIGRQVSIRFNVATTANNTTTGASFLTITGLPIAAGNTSGSPDYGQCNLELYSGVNFDTGFTQLAGIITPTSSTIGLYEVGAGKTYQQIDASKTILPASLQLQGMCTYHSP